MVYNSLFCHLQHFPPVKRLGIHRFLLYTHSVDFCYDSTFIYARSDAFEALMAAIALDAGLDMVDRIFGAVIFGDDARIHRVWVSIPLHPLQGQYPDGDRAWATKVPMLKRLPVLESELGIQFKHLRLLARAMTIRKTGFNFYTLGDNQRLEFLGDSILKYVSTDYLFRHFPRHHEGHLSLLKNSLVNKYTQAAVCSELGLDQFVIRREDNSSRSSTAGPCLSQQEAGDTCPTSASVTVAPNQNVKYRADLLEAFIGALFVDKDLVWVERFCQVCFWPRLVEFILKQEWNDAKSKLQQCCLTYRSLHEYPEIAHYKVLEQTGPTNHRTYLIGVYFRGERLATGSGRSVQLAQMEAARNALELHQDTFRQLDFQRSVISRRYRQPYIDKMLNHVQSWDERLVDYFVADVNDDTTSGERRSSAAADVPNKATELRHPLSRRSSVLETTDRLTRAASSSHSQSVEHDRTARENEGCEADECGPSSDAMDISSDSESVAASEDAVLLDSTLPSGTLADLFRQRKTENI